MSIYKELNELNIDVSELEEIPLTKTEKKSILKKFKKNVNTRKPNKAWVGLAIAAACIITLSLAIDKGTIASMPFFGGTIEKYINEIENLNYSAYKTAIGESSETNLGKITLNEVMMDDQRLFISSTYEPADNINFDYQTNIFPKVKINGKEYVVSTGAQSIEVNSSLFMVYNHINLSESIATEDLQIEISYDNWDYKDEVISQPWTFSVAVSQENLLKEKRTFEMNETIELINGDKVVIQRVVSTPISTTVYYDLTEASSEAIQFRIEAEDGTSQTFSEAHTSTESGDVSYSRFNGFSLADQNYYLVAYDSFEDTVLSETPVQIK